MSRPRPEGLDELEQRQLQVTAELDRQLAAEQQALREHRPEALEPLAAEKARLAAELEGLEQQRRALLARTGTSAALPPPLAAALDRCAEQNRINGMLIAAGRRRTQMALEVLRGGAPGEQIYDARGEATAASAGTPLAKA